MTQFFTNNYFDPFYFLIAFAIGIFFNFMVKPKPKIIIKYPTPFNMNTIYKDDADNCYKYNLVETSCNVSPDDIFKMPIQTL